MHKRCHLHTLATQVLSSRVLLTAVVFDEEGAFAPA